MEGMKNGALIALSPLSLSSRLIFFAKRPLGWDKPKEEIATKVTKENAFLNHLSAALDPPELSFAGRAESGPSRQEKGL